MNTYMKSYMKKIISKIVSLVIAVAIMATALVGCNNSTQDIIPSTFTQYPDGREHNLVEDKNAKGELNIEYYTLATTRYELSDGEHLKTTLDLFQEKYPNVKLNFTMLDYNDYEPMEYFQKLSTRIMSGDGPDIVWLIDVPNADINKMVEAGALADLTNYFINDENFNINEYNKNLFYGSQIGGKQYFVPIDYTVPMYMCTNEIIQDAQLNTKQLNNYPNCIDELIRIASKNKYKAPIENIICYSEFTSSFPFYSGIDFISQEEKTVNIIMPEIEESYKTMKEFQVYENRSVVPISITDTLLKRDSTLVGDVNFMTAIYNARTISENNETPLLVPIKGVDGYIYPLCGKKIAVSDSSQNKDNAYRFIKTYISAETYAKNIPSSSAFYNFPICNKAITDYLMRPNAGENTNDMSETQLDAKIPEQFKENIFSIINNCKYYDVPGSVQLIMQEEMLPYLKDEKSYEECIQSAQSKLEIYISE